MSKRKKAQRKKNASTKTSGGGGPIVIQIKRHLAGPPRRSPGQVLRITRHQIRQQGLKNTDFRVIRIGASNPAT